ncbi:MAG: DUF5060 domain-containing protein [Verrucomicrobia bacterium]|nr:DUF5060 domain-containing protein [Verrucomicrobiota bacterium]
MKNILIAIACRIATVFASAAENPTIRGELKQWHKVTLTLDGPSDRETDIDPNPFTDYRLTVTFKRESGAPEYRVPGYFAVSGTMNMGGNIGSFVASLAFPYLLKWTGDPKVFFFVGAALNIFAVAMWLLVRPEKSIEEY